MPVIPWQCARPCFGMGTKMADEIPIIPKVSVLEVKTGNIVNWNRLKRKPSQNPTDEVCYITYFEPIEADSE